MRSSTLIMRSPISLPTVYLQAPIVYMGGLVSSYSMQGGACQIFSVPHGKHNLLPRSKPGGPNGHNRTTLLPRGPSPPIWKGIGGGVEGKQGFGIDNKLHLICCQFYNIMASLAIDVICECCDGSIRHLRLLRFLVKHGVTDTKLLFDLPCVAKWHFAKPT